MTDVMTTGYGKRTEDDEFIYEALPGPYPREDLFHLGYVGWFPHRKPYDDSPVLESPMYFPGPGWRQDRVHAVYA